MSASGTPSSPRQRHRGVSRATLDDREDDAIAEHGSVVAVLSPLWAG